MQIRINHKLGQEEAMSRIESWLDQAMRTRYPGVTVKNPSKVSTGNTVEFSFRARKDYLPIPIAISGRIRVEDRLAVVDCELPRLVTTFVPEETIRKTASSLFKNDVLA